MPTRKTRTKAQDGAHIVKAIFAAAESMGISDRNVVEQLTGQVLQRLGAAPTLPGMEDLVAPQPPPEAVKAEAVKAVIREVLLPPPHAKPGALQLTENALRVLERRYLKKDAQGQPAEAPEEMFRRVAHNIAQAELLYDGRDEAPRWEAEFYRLMTALEFLPNSPTLMNAGRELQQLSACFVLPVGDSMEEIFDAVKYTALIQKSGGGTGFSFSRLRPEGDFVGSTSGVASGPVSFMKIFDITTDVTKQGGTRRGANMGILSVHHPDIRKFINAKADPRAFINFNISVAVSDTFMKAVAEDGEYDLINPRNGQVHSRVRAKEILDLIVDSAWRTGDPGVVFLDRINEANPTPHLGSIEATNPCGEQPLLPFESCNLGSINLARMLRRVNSHWEWDREKLERTVTVAVRFLDDVIDMNNYPFPEIARMTRANRKVGLGVMGFADALLRLGIPYDSEEALRAA
ncbi:MAG: adenosylcobalamin-dependent ribonucleoside-diphosphate reductase, partial [Chloroflexota bacterium]